MHSIMSLLLSTLAVGVAAYVLPGIHVASFWNALVIAIMLGIANSLVFPFLIFITLPINILSLGLFTFVIMGFLVVAVSKIVPGFTVDGFWWALAFSLVLAVVNAFLKAVF